MSNNKALVNLLVVERRCGGGRVGSGVGRGGGRVLSTLGPNVVNDGTADRVVEGLCTLGGRELEPENESGLDGEVPWNVVQDNAESDALDEGEPAEDDPVCQPLNVVIVTGSLESAEGEVGGEGPTDEVGDGESEGVDEDKADEGDGGDESTVGLGDLSLLFELDKDGVLAQLFVELSDVLEEAVLALLDYWVSLDLLGGVVNGSLCVRNGGLIL